MSEFWQAVEASDVVRRLGWALLHSLWLGTVAAGMLAVAGRAMRRLSANARYAAGCAALLAVVALSTSAYFFVPTSTGSTSTGVGPYAVGHLTSGPEASPPPAHEPKGLAAMPAFPRTVAASVNPGDGVAPGAAPTAPPPAAPVEPLRPLSLRASASQIIEPALPWLAAAWAVGVAALALWQSSGWAAAWRIRQRAGRPHTDAPGEAIARLARTMNVRARVEVLESTRVSVPALIGWLRPVVLLPVGLASGLSPIQLEAILAHELAHVRRHDYLVNLLQSLVETLFFYHPAVWYISARIRAEREHCCDDVVVAHGTEPVAYAESLLCIARRALAARGVLVMPPALALGAVGCRPSDLRRRVRRILAGGTEPTTRLAGSWPAGLLLISAVIALTVLHSDPRSHTSRAADSNPPAAKAGEGEKPAATRPAAPRPPQWGDATNGLRSRLSAAKQVFRAGEPIPVKLEIENVGKQVAAYQTPAAPHNHAIIVVDEQGKATPYLGGLSQVMVRPETLAPGQSREVKSFDLAESYYLRRPGRYSVRWPGEIILRGDPDAAAPPVSPASAPFEFDVIADPELAAADGDPVGRLLPLIKEDWWLGGGSSQPAKLRPGGNRAEVNGRSMSLLYAPTMYKKDSGHIWLWLTDEAAAEQSVNGAFPNWPPISEYLGKIDRWHVYAHVDANAQKAWPAAKDEIKQSLAAEHRQPGERTAALKPPEWGEAKDGLRARLLAARQVFRAGESIPVTLEVQNVSDGARNAKTPAVVSHQALKVLDEHGNEAPYLHGLIEDQQPPEVLGPGHTRALKSLDVAEFYYLRRPGRYTVRWLGEPGPGSMEIDVTADPALAAADGNPVGRLLPLVRDQWWLGAGFAPAKGQFLGGSRTPATNWFLGFHSRPLGNKDSTLVWLTLRDGPAPAAERPNLDSSRHPSEEYLGQISRWHVYIVETVTGRKEWPTAKDDIKRALAAEPNDDYYRALHDRYRDQVLDAARAGNKGEISTLTDKFNESIGGKLLYVQVVSRVGPIDKHVTLLSKFFGDRKVTTGKIHYAVSDKPYVTQNANGEGHVLIATNPLADSKWPNDVQITLLMDPVAPGAAGPATRPAAQVPEGVPAAPAGQQQRRLGGSIAEIHPSMQQSKVWLDLKECLARSESGYAFVSVDAAGVCRLSLASTSTSDLSYLKGATLDSLDLSNTVVKDLSPLEGMPLRRLDISGTQVADLSPLKGMKLTSLRMSNIKVRDLSPLASAKLTELDATSTPIADLSPLAGMPLDYVDIRRTAVKDLSPLAGTPLATLELAESQVTDFRPLHKTRLRTLTLSAYKGLDLSQLADIPLKRMTLSGKEITDLSPLRGMKFESLQINDTGVRDVAPLAGMPLRYLSLSGSPVSDLTPLKEMKLTDLYLSEPGADLAPLAGMPLETVGLPDVTTVRNIDVLRGVKTLQWIRPPNSKPLPVAEFWVQYDAGKFRS